MTVPRSARVALLAGAAVLALVPLSGDRFWLQFAGKVMITCLFAVSLDLLVGYAGLVSLAHSAFFGLSAYLLAALGNQLGVASVFATLPLCIAFAALAALLIGWLSLRASGVYFVMVTLAFTQMLYYLFSESPGLGGSDGVFIAQRPRVLILGRTLLDLGDRTAAYALNGKQIENLSSNPIDMGRLAGNITHVPVCSSLQSCRFLFASALRAAKSVGFFPPQKEERTCWQQHCV